MARQVYNNKLEALPVEIGKLTALTVLVVSEHRWRLAIEVSYSLSQSQDRMLTNTIAIAGLQRSEDSADRDRQSRSVGPPVGEPELRRRRMGD